MKYQLQQRKSKPQEPQSRSKPQEQSLESNTFLQNVKI